MDYNSGRIILFIFLLIIPFSLQINTYSFDNKPIVTNDINSLREEYENIINNLNNHNLNDFTYQQTVWDIVKKLNNLQYKTNNNSITLDWYSNNIIPNNSKIDNIEDIYYKDLNNNNLIDKKNNDNKYSNNNNNKLKIVLVVSSFEGLYSTSGIGTVYSILADFLVGRGHHVTVLYARDEATERLSFSEWKQLLKEKRNIELLSLPASPVPIDNPYLVKRSYQIYQYLKQHHYDIIHFPDFEGMGYYTSLAKSSGLHFQRSKIVVGLHGPSSWVIQSNTQNHATQESEFELDYMERKSAELADAIWTPSTYIVDWLRHQGWEIPSEKLALLSFLSPSSSDSNSTQSIQSPLINELVFFGRLEQRKGVVLFCDALDLLAKQGSTFELKKIKVTFLGRSSNIKGESSTAYIRNRSTKWPFSISFITDKASPEALDYLSKPNRLAIIPSLEDNAPYTLYECLYKKIPVIASSTASMVPLIDKRDREDVLFDTKPHYLFRKLASSIKNGVTVARPTFTALQSFNAWSLFYSDLEKHTAITNSATDEVNSHQQPLVSVCIAHYNRPYLLKQAIQSIEKQTYKNYEIIVVDDGSNQTDALDYLGSLESQFKKRHWKIIKTPNRYLGAARNTAVREARGQYIYFLDDDNAAYPEALSTYVKVARHTDADVVTAPHSIITTLQTPGEHTQIQRQWIPLGPSLSVGLFKNCFGDANFFIRRSAFIQSGGFTEEYGVGLEDHELLAKLAIDGYKMAIATDPLLYYRMHDKQGQMVYRTDTKSNQMRYIRPYQSVLSDAKPMMKLLARNTVQKLETCNITLTSVSPSNGPMTGGTVVTIQGSGFLCPIQAVFIGGQQCQGLLIDADAGRISCTTPRGLTPMPVDINVMSNQGRNYTLFSGFTYTSLTAPKLQTCTLNAAGTTIQCEFKPETNTKPKTCEQYLSQFTLEKLGEEPTCIWTDPTTLTVTLGHASTIEIGDVIEFKAGSVESVGGEPNNRESVQLTSLVAITPTATIKAPEDIGPCDDLILDGSYSLSGGGSSRGLIYQWSLVKASSRVDELTKLLSSSFGSKVLISNNTMDVGASYTFQLKVTNSMGKSHTTTATVFKKSVDVVIVKILGPEVLTIPTRDLSIEGIATYSGCDAKGSDSLVNYQWSVSPHFPLDPATSITKNLYVDHNSWVAGKTYTFTLTATIGRKSALATIDVTITKGPVFAVITGGDKIYGQGQIVTLDASKSVDPDDSTTTLSYNWVCSPVQFNKDCGLEMPAEPMVVFNSSDLKPGKYIFQVEVSPDDDPSRASTAVTAIVITTGSFIDVEINKTALPLFIDPGQKIILRSVLINNRLPLEQLEFSWTLDSGELTVDETDAYSTPTNQRNLGLKSGSLAGGTLYTFTVHVRDIISNITGEADITFRTEARPSGGRINCYTQKGTIFDKFTIDMGRNWGAASGIIGYSFTYKIDSNPEEFPLGDRSMSSLITTYLPPGTIRIIGYALSGNGVASSSSCVIHVDPPSPDDAEKVIDFISNIMESPQLTLYEISFSLRLGNVILPPAKGKLISNAQVAEKVSGFKTTAIDILNDQIVSNDSRITTERLTSMVEILNTATETLQILRPNTLASAMGIMKSLSQGFVENPVLPSGINSSIAVIGNINHQMNRQINNIDPAMKTSVKTISKDLDLVAHQIANAILFRSSSGEEPMIISKQGVTISTFKQDTMNLKKNGAVAVGISGDPTFTIQPSSLDKIMSGYQSHQEIGVKYVVFPGNPHYDIKLDNNLKFISKNAFSLDLVQDQGKEVKVSGVVDPIVIDAGNGYDPDDTHECVWWDASKQNWNSAGCVTVFRDGTVFCKCSHLTQFAVIGRAKANSDWSKIAIIVGCVVGAALFAGLMVGMFVVVKRRRAQKKRTPKDKAKKDELKKKKEEKAKGKEKAGENEQSSSGTTDSPSKKKKKKSAAKEDNPDALNVPTGDDEASGSSTTVVDAKKKKSDRIEQSFGDENDNEFILNEFKEIYEIVKKKEIEDANMRRNPVSPLTTNASISTDSSPTTSLPSYQTSPQQFGPYTEEHSVAASALQKLWRKKQHIKQLKRELEVEELVENIDDLLADETADPFEENDYEAGDYPDDDNANQA